MAQFEIDKKLKNKSLARPAVKWSGSKASSIGDIVKKGLLNGCSSTEVSPWNFIYAYIFFFLAFSILITSIAKLQIVEGAKMAERWRVIR